jgi:oligosaccharide repeat unit polymerase
MAVSASLGAYGSWPWESAYGNLGDETFVYSLIGMLLPASGLAFAYFVQTGRGQRRAWAIIGYVAVLALLAADGKRTPALFVLAGHGVFYLTGTRSALRKILVLSAIAIVGVALASAMYLFRVGGMGQVISGDSEGYELVYHQDDSYYKSVRALHIAGSSNERWDPVVFLYTTVVNPVPRFLWPNKPALLQEYWGEYKDYWVTISFVGELVAMFGPVVGVILSIIVAWGLFALLRRTFLLTVEPGGIIVYLAVALYCYMVMRSLLNITQFIYLPAFTYLIFLAQRRGFVRHAVALS